MPSWLEKANGSSRPAFYMHSDGRLYTRMDVRCGCPMQTHDVIPNVLYQLKLIDIQAEVCSIVFQLCEVIIICIDVFQGGAYLHLYWII